MRVRQRLRDREGAVKHRDIVSRLTVSPSLLGLSNLFKSFPLDGTLLCRVKDCSEGNVDRRFSTGWESRGEGSAPTKREQTAVNLGINKMSYGIN